MKTPSLAVFAAALSLVTTALAHAGAEGHGTYVTVDAATGQFVPGDLSAMPAGFVPRADYRPFDLKQFPGLAEELASLKTTLFRRGFLQPEVMLDLSGFEIYLVDRLSGVDSDVVAGGKPAAYTFSYPEIEDYAIKKIHRIVEIDESAFRGMLDSKRARYQALVLIHEALHHQRWGSHQIITPLIKSLDVIADELIRQRAGRVGDVSDGVMSASIEMEKISYALNGSGFDPFQRQPDGKGAHYAFFVTQRGGGVIQGWALDAFAQDSHVGVTGRIINRSKSVVAHGNWVTESVMRLSGTVSSVTDNRIEAGSELKVDFAGGSGEIARNRIGGSSVTIRKQLGGYLEDSSFVRSTVTGDMSMRRCVISKSDLNISGNEISDSQIQDSSSQIRFSQKDISVVESIANHLRLKNVRGRLESDGVLQGVDAENVDVGVIEFSAQGDVRLRDVVLSELEAGKGVQVDGLNRGDSTVTCGRGIFVRLGDGTTVADSRIRLNSELDWMLGQGQGWPDFNTPPSDAEQAEYGTFALNFADSGCRPSMPYWAWQQVISAKERLYDISSPRHLYHGDDIWNLREEVILPAGSRVTGSELGNFSARGPVVITDSKLDLARFEAEKGVEIRSSRLIAPGVTLKVSKQAALSGLSWARAPGPRGPREDWPELKRVINGVTYQLLVPTAPRKLKIDSAADLK